VCCFAANYENKKFKHAALFLSTSAPHLTELGKVFQAEYLNFAQVKASVELCNNKLSDAAAKPELEANREKFDSEFGELRTPVGCVSSGMAFWKGTKRLANRSSPYTKRETGVNEPTTVASLVHAMMPRK